MSAELHLWRAVIVQAIDDARMRVRDVYAPQGTSRADRKEAIRAMQKNILTRDQAREWLLRNSRDFPKVCYMASLDPDAVREAAQALARRGWPPLAKSRPQQHRAVQTGAVQ